jgi:hypothetical protein
VAAFENLQPTLQLILIRALALRVAGQAAKQNRRRIGQDEVLIFQRQSAINGQNQQKHPACQTPG